MDVVNPDTGERWHVPTGMCGWACVKILHGNSSLAYYAKKHLGYSKSYYGGVSRGVRWSPNEVDLPGTACQSYELNSAYARAYAQVFREAGHEVYADCRVD